MPLLMGGEDMVYVFIDNSNIWIEGKFAVAEVEGIGMYDAIRRHRCLQELQIDYGQLLSTILSDRPLGGHPVIVGSRPPPNDSLWHKCRQYGFEVKVFDRNVDNKEKKVDMQLGTAVLCNVFQNVPATIVLVAGDGDYSPVIDEAQGRNWMIEVWFWRSGKFLMIGFSHIGFLSP
jgi:hypothetical protein